jgi:hypothetical protein
MEQSIMMPLNNDEEEMRRMAAMVVLAPSRLLAAAKTSPDANETNVHELFDLPREGPCSRCALSPFSKQLEYSWLLSLVFLF